MGSSVRSAIAVNSRGWDTDRKGIVQSHAGAVHEGTRIVSGDQVVVLGISPRFGRSVGDIANGWRIYQVLSGSVMGDVTDVLRAREGGVFYIAWPAFLRKDGVNDGFRPGVALNGGMIVFIHAQVALMVKMVYQIGIVVSVAVENLKRLLAGPVGKESLLKEAMMTLVGHYLESVRLLSYADQLSLAMW